MNILPKKKNHELKWFIFYTSPRAEKIAYKQLVDKRYETFLPLQKNLKIWKNRQRKFVEEPLFPGYIFVKSRLSEIYNITKIRGICMCITFGGKPCTIPDKDIEAIQIMILFEQEVSSSNDFSEGEKVFVIRGPLTGYEGILFKQKGNSKFGIRVQGVDLIAAINISIEDVQKQKISCP